MDERVLGHELDTQNLISFAVYFSLSCITASWPLCGRRLWKGNELGDALLAMIDEALLLRFSLLSAPLRISSLRHVLDKAFGGRDGESAT